MSDDTLLGKLADAFIREVRQGKLPEIEKYALKHPELAERIREIFPTLLLLEGMSAAAGPVQEESPGPTGLSPGNRFGHYRIDREIGRGGMGIVYEARHLLLEKRVALKVLPVRPFMDATHLERFFREARTAAGLHHTNIVPVFDVGQVSGIPYYAMQFIEGQNLDAILRIMQSSITHEPAPAPSSDSTFDTDNDSRDSSVQKASPDKHENSTSRFFADPSVRIRAGLPGKLDEYFRFVAGMGVQAAEGLAHAHERKVIHRDIKPSNLILDNRGVLWITDFGLARRTEDPAMTRSGTVLGTPRYMSPEQAEAARHPVDRRSDIYSLGATLYELLTCRPVFEGDTPHDVISQIITREPVAPRRLNKEIPADLSTIVMKAMAKRPEDRYQSAFQLAEDLNRWLRVEPIKARRIGPVGRTIRWCRRNPRLAAVTAGAVAIILALSGVYYAGLLKENAITRQALRHETEARNQTLVALNQAEESKQEAEAERGRAVEALNRAEKERENTRAALKREQKARAIADLNSYSANLAAADQYLRNDLIVQAERHLEACKPDLRGWEWRYLQLRTDESLAIINLDYEPLDLTLSQDGSNLLWRSLKENGIEAADASSRRMLPLPVSDASEEGETPSYLVAFSRDRSWIARTRWIPDQIQMGPEVIAMDRADFVGPNILRNLLEIAHSFNAPAISRLQLDSAGIWEGKPSILNTLDHPLFFLEDKRPIISARFSPDGSVFAAWSWNGKMLVGETASGEKLCSLDGNPLGGLRVAFSPDGRFLAAGYYDGDIRVWPVPSGIPVAVLHGHADPISCLAFTPDGRRIVSGDYFSKINLWDLTSGEPVWTSAGHSGYPNALAFSNDGSRIAEGCSDNNIYVLDAATGKELLSLSGHKSQVTSVLFDSSGDRIISGSPDKSIRFWNAASPSYKTSIPITDGYATSAVWGRGGRNVAVTSATWQSTRTVSSLLDPDEMSALVWDPKTGKTSTVAKAPILYRNDIPIRSSGDKLLVDADSSTQIVDLLSRIKPVNLEMRDGNITHEVFSPDGKILAGVYLQDAIALWDASSGRLLSILRGHTKWINKLAFSPNGNRIVSAGNDTTLRVWETATGRSLNTLQGHTEPVIDVTFSPEGKQLVSSSSDGTIRIWDGFSGKIRFVLNCEDSKVVYSPDGKRIFSGCRDGILKAWDANTGAPINSSKPVGGHFKSLDINPEGNRIVAATDAAMIVYDADSLSPLLTIPNREGEFDSATFSPDGEQILSVGGSVATVWKSKRVD